MEHITTHRRIDVMSESSTGFAARFVSSTLKLGEPAFNWLLVKSIALASSFRLIVLAVLAIASGAIEQRASAQSAPLRLTISGTNQSVVLTWFGDDNVAYQLESSPD